MPLLMVWAALSAKAFSQLVGAISKDLLNVWTHKPAMHDKIKGNGITHEVPHQRPAIAGIEYMFMKPLVTRPPSCSSGSNLVQFAGILEPVVRAQAAQLRFSPRCVWTAVRNVRRDVSSKRHQDRSIDLTRFWPMWT